MGPPTPASPPACIREDKSVESGQARSSYWAEGWNGRP